MKKTPSTNHIPVMRNVAVHMLGCRSEGLYVDGTLGGGGYTEAILEASTPGGRLLAIDLDEAAVERARSRFESQIARLSLHRANFADIGLVLREAGWPRVDGVVLDLGVSSFQLDDPRRGFSFRADGPLDMRMDLTLTQTAADLVNRLPEKELARMITELGEERWARRIAHAIVTQRKSIPFQRTLQLAELVQMVVPRTADSRRIHPATRTFQALRLAVNRELDSLKRFLGEIIGWLAPGGRLVIVAFHSLEDRMVKEHFKMWAKPCRCPRGFPSCDCEGPLVRLLTKRALRPSEHEVASNPRARSARLRAVERLSEAVA
ncbi:MAG: 16S rRNA (cytosine(1402)-N(4))-methyltransferase RsmH [Syntrophobacteraceae bacterium]|jgi:16S rRNA (cytosine1402-N4)-methyltransferase|nr:16S rRNA (cytosine(1402)-N(4))-methyltransferase RsmH [Syntrophobacteraceae bacterium]